MLPAEPQLIKAHAESTSASTLPRNGNGAEHPVGDGATLPLPTPAAGLERRSDGDNRNGLAPGGTGLASCGIGLAAGGNGSAPGPSSFDANASTHAAPAAQPPRQMMPRPAAVPLAPANGEQRRKLHLSLGGNGNGHSALVDPPVAVAAPAPQPPAGERSE
ncbi:MAG: hypothetical protein ACREFB_06030, partial [Stellaceae bacterium]